MAQATVRIRGNATEALAALDALGIKTEEVSKESETVMGRAAASIGAMFAKVGETIEKVGFEAGASLTAVGDHMVETEIKGKGLSSSLAGIGKAALLGVGAGALILGKLGVSAEMAAEKVDAQLRVAVENTGKSFEELEPQIKATDARMRGFGFTNEQTNSALTTLTRGLGSVSKAQALMGVAADLARSKNIDLGTAATLVMKASEGQTRALKQLGIDLPVYAGGAQATYVANLALSKAQQNLNFLLQKTPDAINPASKAHQSYEKAVLAVHDAQVKLQRTQDSGKTIIDALTKKVHGSADAYGHTLAGQIQVAKAKFDNLAEQIGKVLVPILTKLLEKTEAVVGWMGKHKDIAVAVAGVVGGIFAVAVGVKAVNAIAAFGDNAGKAISTLSTWGTKIVEFGVKYAAQTATFLAESAAQVAGWVAQAAAATAAFVAENAATLGIAAAIAALVAAVIWLATHWHEAWTAIKDAAKAVWDFLKPVFTAIGDAIKTYVMANVQMLQMVWNAAWSAIKTVMRAAYDNVIQPVASAIGWAFTNVIMKPLQALNNLFGSVWGGIVGAIKWAWGIIEPVLHAMQTALDKVGSAIGKVTGVIGKGISGAGKGLSFISGGLLADGGPATSGVPYIVGENGPELFIPDSSGTVIPNGPTTRILGGGSHPSVGGVGGDGVSRQDHISDMVTAQRAAQMDVINAINGLKRAPGLRVVG